MIDVISAATASPRSFILLTTFWELAQNRQHFFYPYRVDHSIASDELFTVEAEIISASEQLKIAF
jgi:hypothetical protein